MLVGIDVKVKGGMKFEGFLRIDGSVDGQIVAPLKVKTMPSHHSFAHLTSPHLTSSHLTSPHLTSLQAPVKANQGADLPNQPRRQTTTVQATTAPDGGADSERIAMVTPRSQSTIGRAKELGDEMYGTKGHRDGDPSVRDDMSPEARVTIAMPFGVWGKKKTLQPPEVRAIAVVVVVVVVTCYNEEKVWEKMSVSSIIIDGRVMASQAVLNFWQNDLGVFSSEVSLPSCPVSNLP